MLFIAMYEASKRAALAAGLGGPASRECESANQGQEDTSSSGSRGRSGLSSHSAETTVSTEGNELTASPSASSLSGGRGAADAVDAVLPPWVLGVCSAGSASLAGVLTHPADVVKTRLQVMGASSSSSSSSSSSAGPSVTAAADSGDGRHEGGRACQQPVGGPPRPTARSVAADMLRREGIQVWGVNVGREWRMDEVLLFFPFDATCCRCC